MKKTMIFAIILLPLIILGVVFLSGVVVNFSTYVYVENVEFVESSIVLDKNDENDVSAMLQVNVYPQLANNKELSYHSENPEIVSVDESGKITGHDFGETYIYATSKENATKQAMCKVVVTSDHVHRVWVENPTTKMYVGDEHRLVLCYAPREAQDVELETHSSNPEVLYVSSDGNLIANKKGTARISISLKSNPAIRCSFDVLVKVRAEDIYIEDASSVVSALVEFDFPEVKFTPSEASEELSYFSSDETIATVDKFGHITFFKAGTVLISASIEELEDKIISKSYSSLGGYFSSVMISNSNPRVLQFEEWQDKTLELLWTALPNDGNKNNVWFESSNEGVIKVENGELKVVGGGEATISLVAKSSSDTTIRADWTIEVKRNVSQINFGISDFLVTSSKTVDLGTTFFPSDATEQITYEVSDPTLASVQNGRLVFSQNVVSNKFGKVKVTAKTQSGAQKSVVVAYVDKDIEKIEYAGQSSLDFTLAKTGESPVVFALIVPSDGRSDVELKLVGNTLTQNGYIFTPCDKGTSKIEIYFDDIDEPSHEIEINIKREVEKINNLKVTATWTFGLQEFSGATSVYSSSDTFEFSYDLFPKTATLQKANASLVGDCAEIVDGKIVFASAGKVTLVLTADEAEARVEIESTLLHPDEDTSVEQSFEMNKGETINLWNKISISPENASSAFITFNKTGDSISLDDEGNVMALCGGEATIVVNVETATGSVQKTIGVFVKEEATSVEAVGAKYIFSSTNTFDLNGKFKSLPTTANIKNTLTYGVEGDGAVINSQNVITFSKAGRFVVWAKLDDTKIAKISIIYANDNIVLSGGENVLVGTKFVIKPSQSALDEASFDTNFVAKSGATLSNDVFVTITGNATIAFGDETYNFVCVQKMTDASIEPKNTSDVDVNETNITGLKSLEFVGNVFGTGEEYVQKSFEIEQTLSRGAQIATIDEFGVLSFSSAGKVRIVLSATYVASVIGAQNQKIERTYEIQSTFGEILSLSVEGTNRIEFVIDDLDPSKNVLDISKLLTPFPSQIQISSENVQISSSNVDAASVSGLFATFKKGGSVTISLNTKSGDNFVFANEIVFDVKKNAEKVLLNGVEIYDGIEKTINKSSMFLNFKTLPSDANINCDVSWQVEQNDGVAEIDHENNRIKFGEANKKIKLKITLGSGENKKEFGVYVQTSTITYEVDISLDTIIVPVNETFTFVSETGEISELFVDFGTNFGTVQQISQDTFLITKSAVGEIGVSYDGDTSQKQLIVTTDFSAISQVWISDVDMAGEEQNVAMNQNDVFVTASKSVGIKCVLPVGYDKFGEQIKYTISTHDQSIAKVNENNELVFEKAGDAYVTIEVTYQDVFSTHNISFAFVVQSTFGAVSQFEVSKSEYNFVYDDMSEEDKKINIVPTLTRLAPLFGEVDAPSIEVEDESVAKIVDGKVEFCGSGNTKIVVSWGKQTSRLPLVVDKYIDALEIIDGGEVVSQIVTKKQTYPLSYRIATQKLTPTLTDVEFLVDGEAQMNGQSVVFTSENTKVVLTIRAKQGSASAQLVMIYVGENVNVIPCDSTLQNIVIEAGTTNIFDFKYGENVVWLDEISGNAQIVDGDLGLFKANAGTSGKLLLNNGQEINYVATQEVERIDFSESALKDGLVTGKDTFDLADCYGASIYPSTARNEAGAYEIEYSLSSDIASINDGILSFSGTGSVVITFSAGGVTRTRTLESTMGKAKSVEFVDTTRMVFEFVDGQFIVTNDQYTIFPADADKADITLSSSNTNVFTTDQNTLTFVGGGLSALVLTYASVDGEKSISKEVFVINRATGIIFKHNKKQTGYIVTNAQNGQTMILDYEIISDGDMSDHIVEFISSDESVATISDGVITFVSDGRTTISVRVRDKLNEAGVFDVEANLTLINKPNHNILDFEDEEEFVVETGSKNVLYPITNQSVAEFEFEIESGSEVLSIGEDGEIVEKQGGEAVVLVKGKNPDWSKRISIYIHKTASIQLDQTPILTSKSSLTLDASFAPSDALVRKQIKYISSNETIAKVSETGVVEFLTAGTVTVTIKVLYEGEEEDSKQIKIESTKGKVQSFDISCEGGSELDWTLFVGASKTFVVKNILPTDFSGELQVVSQNPDAHQISISGTSFIVTAVQRLDAGGNITVGFVGSDFTQNVAVTVKQLSTSISFKQNGVAVEEVKSFSNVISLTADVLPSNANDKSVSWSIVGNASISDGVVTFVEGEYGAATVTATANDGGARGSIVVRYLQDISDFTISHSGSQINENEVILVDYNKMTVTLQIGIVPADLVGFDFFSAFVVSSQEGSSVGALDSKGYVTITLPSDVSEFEDIINIVYKDKISKSIKIYRDGIQSVDFGDHTEKNDALCGLQEMRVFGNQSFYDGTIQNYYKMEFNVLPEGRASGLVWKSDNSKVTLEQQDGYVKIFFNQVSGSTVDEVYADNFAGGEVRVWAENKYGKQLQSYTFHIVSGVNIWDQDGFTGGGMTLVLQKSLGHDDQADAITAGTVSRLDAYAAKTTIFGNGFLISYAWQNINGKPSSGGSSLTGGKWKYIASSLTNAINVTIQGANFDSTRETYLIEFSGSQKFAYCEVYNMYRAVELGGGTSDSPTVLKIKKSIFHTFAHSTINASNDGYREIYLTDVIMFDVGYRAIESQSSNDKIYISGFFDVYNFQNAASLAKALGNKESYAEQVIEEAQKAGLTTTALGEEWANVVIIATKQTDKNSAKTKVFYDGVENSSSDLTKLTVQVKLIGTLKYEYAAWATPKNHSYMTWSNEFNSDGTLNEAYMISTMPKLKRT